MLIDIEIKSTSHHVSTATDSKLGHDVDMIGSASTVSLSFKDRQTVATSLRRFIDSL